MSLAELFRIIILLTFSVSVFAKEVEKVNFADDMTLGAQKLVLNGAGLRIKSILGTKWNVYVGGLYLPKKSSDDKAIIASDETKVLRLVFKRTINEYEIGEALAKSFKANCKLDCDNMKSGIKAFEKLMVDFKDGDELTLTFEKDGLKVDSKTKESKSAKVDGAAFSKNMMAAFIGDEPPTPEFKAALLGK